MIKKQIYDESNGLSYTLQGNYYLPDLVLPEEETVTYRRYGMLRREFLKEHRKGLNTTLLLQGRLVKHLNQTDLAAKERMGLLMRQMAEQQGVTEQLKAEKQLLWVRKMNNIRNAAEEIVLKELIHA